MGKHNKEKVKKEISEKVAVKAIITSYICYGFIFFFIYNILKNTVSTSILENIQKNLNQLGYLIPVLFGILTLFIIHLLCRLSTVDVFRKCTMDPKKTKYVMQNLKVFFVGLILVSLVYTYVSLYVSINIDSQSVLMSTMQYSKVFSPGFTTKLSQEMLTNFNNFRDYAFKDAFISEVFFVVAIISLSSFQRKMLDVYNTFDAEEEAQEELKKLQKLNEIKEDLKNI